MALWAWLAAVYLHLGGRQGEEEGMQECFFPLVFLPPCTVSLTPRSQNLSCVPACHTTSYALALPCPCLPPAVLTIGHCSHTCLF